MNRIPEVKGSQDSSTQKKYERPELITFGSVAKLTQGQNGTKFDVGHNNNTKKGGQ